MSRYARLFERIERVWDGFKRGPNWSEARRRIAVKADLGALLEHYETSHLLERESTTGARP